MRASILAAAAYFLASVSAIQILTPTKDEKVDLNGFSYTVTWETVSSDPKTAHLFLVNQAGGHTPYSKDLGEIDLTKGSFTVGKFTISPDTAYQFNIQSVTPNNMGILAQSQQFEIIKSGSSSSSSSTTSAPTATVTGSGSNPGQSTVSVPTSSTLVPTTTTALNGTSTSSPIATVKPNSAAGNQVGGFLAVVLGAAALLA